MEAIEYTHIRPQLMARRRRLEAAIAEAEEPAQLAELLQAVDAALERLDRGTYGLCEICHEPIEPERLLADPLVCICLDHLTADQQRALEQDLDLAAQIQGAMLPKNHVRLELWEACYFYEPAGPVSGDYCDLLPAADKGDLVFLIGDVSGKGIAASLMMTYLHAIFHSLIPLGLPVNRLVGRANKLLCESTGAMNYATLVFGRASQSGEVELCNAGHLPPLVVRGNEVIRLKTTSLPVGLFCEGQFVTNRVQLEPGDSLLLYTDGLTEAWNGTEEYGLERLSKLAATLHSVPPEATINACRQDLAAFMSGAQRTDDLTLMAIQRLPEHR